MDITVVPLAGWLEASGGEGVGMIRGSVAVGGPKDLYVITLVSKDRTVCTGDSTRQCRIDSMDLTLASR